MTDQIPEAYYWDRMLTADEIAVIMTVPITEWPVELLPNNYQPNSQTR